MVAGITNVSVEEIDLSCRTVRVSSAMDNPVVQGKPFNPQDYIKGVIPKEFTPRSMDEIKVVRAEILAQVRPVTVSVIKADVGSLGGHTVVHPDLIKVGRAALTKQD